MNLKKLIASVLTFVAVGSAVSTFALPTFVDQCDLTSGIGETLNPDYVLTGFTSTTNSATISSAPGCTATHARFANTPGTPDVSPAFSVTPNSSPLVVGATYTVAITFGNNTGTAMESASIVVQPTITGASSNNFPATTTAFQQAGGGLNAWAVIGSFIPSIPNPTITFAYDSGTLSGFRFYAYAVQFVEIAPPPPPPAGTPEYWDVNGSTSGIGGTGTWDAATTPNWNTNAAGTGTAGTYVTSGLSVFGGTAGTVSIDAVNGVTSDGGLEFDVDGYTLTGGTLTLGAGTNITVTNASYTATINSKISGTNGMDLYGPGTVVLGASNSVTGTVNISAGTLQLANNHNQAFTSLTGAGSLNLGNNTLTLGDSSGLSLSYDGVMSDAGAGTPGSLLKVGTGTSTLTGVNTFNGTVEVDGGVLSINSNAALGVGTGNVTLNGGTLQNTSGGNVNFINSETRPIVIGASAGGLAVTVPSAVLNYRNGTISGSGLLVKSGGGILRLSDTNTPTSTLVTTPYLAVTGGFWQVADDTSLGAVPTSPLANAITLSGAGGVSANGNLTINPNRLITLAGEATFNIVTNLTMTYNGVVSGTANSLIHETGGGTLVLGGASTFNGNFQVEGGTLAVGNDQSLGVANLDLHSPSVGTPGIRSADANTRTISNPITLGVSAIFGSATSGNLVFTGALNSGSNAKNIFVSNAVTTFAGVITGPSANANSKDGPGTLILTADNSACTKPYTVKAGTLMVNNTSGSGTGSGNITVNAGGTLAGTGSTAAQADVFGAISPGATGPGLLTTADEAWEPGASYTWQINKAGGTAGANPGWAQVNVTGGLNINANSGSPFTINVTSLNLANAAGNVSDFNNMHTYSWSIAHVNGTINGFDPTAFVINTAGFSNSLGNGVFTVTATATDIFLNFTGIVITSTTLSGTTLTLSGTGGQPNATYHVRTSTNAAAALGTWTTLGAAGTYDPSGNFTYPITITPSERHRFYSIEP